jgi:hypothetical protein
MKHLAIALVCACATLCTSPIRAQDVAKRDRSDKDLVMTKDWTVQDCKDRKSMTTRDGARSDAATMKMDRACAERMKAQGRMNKDDNPMSTKRAASDVSVVKKDWTIDDCKNQKAESKKDGVTRHDGAMDGRCADLAKGQRGK